MYHTTQSHIPVRLPPLPYTGILCRYNEIATKGRNRGLFENLLVENLHRQLQPITKFKGKRRRGRILLVPHGRENDLFSASDVECLRQRIQRVFGISSVSPVIETSPELAAVEKVVEDCFPLVYQSFAEAKPRGAIRYAMRARRVSRRHPMSSHELELHFAGRLLPAYPRLQVDLQNPELLVQLEMRETSAFLSFLNFPGPGGMPSGCAGRTLALLSGGFDSPVAAYLMMRRGCPLDFITFHSAPYTPPATLAKVARLARTLNQYQRPGRLFCINLLPAQKAVRDLCNPRYRTVLYRRFMVRIACRIAEEYRILGLATGDNLGQVASQTMENLFVVNKVADRPVFRPLLTYDKNHTLALARNLGTFEISREDAPDSCTVFAPSRPTTMAKPDKIEENEKPLEVVDLIAACLADSTIMNPDTEEQTPLPQPVRS